MRTLQCTDGRDDVYCASHQALLLNEGQQMQHTASLHHDWYVYSLTVGVAANQIRLQSVDTSAQLYNLLLACAAFVSGQIKESVHHQTGTFSCSLGSCGITCLLLSLGGLQHLFFHQI